MIAPNNRADLILTFAFEPLLAGGKEYLCALCAPQVFTDRSEAATEEKDRNTEVAEHTRRSQSFSLWPRRVFSVRSALSLFLKRGRGLE